MTALDDALRLPTANPEAEMAVLGAALISPEAAADVVEALASDDFVTAAHQMIFDCIKDLVNAGSGTDPVTVKGELERRGDMQRVGGIETLWKINDATPTAVNVGTWIRDLREAAGTRRGIASSMRIGQIYANRGLDLDERHDAAQRALDAVTGATADSTGQPVSDLIGPFLDRLESSAPIVGVTTGWLDMDALLNKLRPGQLITVGARPGIGKSVALVNIATHVGVTLREPVLFASLEMSTEEIMNRIVSALARVPLPAIQARTLTDGQWEAIAKAAARLADVEHLVIDETPAAGVGHLRAKLRSMRRAGHPAAVCCVDYLQLMTSPKKTENRQQELSDVCRSLKLLAKEAEVPIVTASQLNRGSEHRTDKRPVLSDLRESGAVEQDSDVVILLHREDAHERESPRAGEIDLIVAKHRQGATATITAAFQGHYSRIVDMAS